ncbi:MAG: response regulator transcription factor [Oscillospiraceae bacterium]|nr:response regulator transcription factor [Oscillospiraceae bacterium]
MYRILIVEDDTVLRKELAALLEKHGYKTITAESFGGIAELAAETSSHLVLLDINLPGSDGFQICRELRSRSAIPIIVVTSRAGDADELVSMHLGADYFITKPYNTQLLLAKISAIIERVYGRGSAEMKHGDLTLNVGKSSVSRGERAAELTKNELRIMQLLIESRGNIVPRDELIHALWQTDSFVDDNTLTVNVNRLRKKLSEIGAAEALKTKRGLGYSL